MPNEEIQQTIRYEYSKVLAGIQSYVRMDVFSTTEEEKTENTICLLKFILKDILRLKTREEAIKYFEENPDELTTYHIASLVQHDNIYFLGERINSFDYVYRKVYDELNDLDGIMDWVCSIKKRTTKEKILNKLRKLGVNVDEEIAKRTREKA